MAELPPRATLDEVQRVPGLFTALKTAVDRRRGPNPRLVGAGVAAGPSVPPLVLDLVALFREVHAEE